MVKEKKHLRKIRYMTLTYGSRSHQMLSSAPPPPPPPPPPIHMTFAPAKFEIATSNSLGEDAFTRKYII